MRTVLDRFVSTSLPGNIPFVTSGTTGRPVTWWRSRRQVLTEAGLLIDMLGLRDVDQVITYAPREHLYGFLFGSVIPALLDLPVHQVDLAAPLPSSADHPLLVTIPASWWHLGRSDRALARFDRITAVHSSALLPPTAGAVVQAQPGLSLTEVHGSTETGMIGTRSYGDGDEWALAADVRFGDDVVVGSECMPRVHSPRLGWRSYAAKPQQMVLSDRVEVTGARRYRLLGRDSRLVKVNGVRVNLEWVELRLRDAVQGTELSCRPVADNVRGEWYDVVVDAGEPQVAVDACQRLLAHWEMPRRVVRSAEVSEKGPGT